MKILKVIFALLLLSIGFSAQAQTGNFFLSHYTPSDERLDYVTFDIAQDKQGVIYFANKSGVLEFDGRNWSLIPTPGQVYTVAAKGTSVYVGGSAGYGKLVWNTENTQAYQSIYVDQPQPPQIISSLIVKDEIFFLSQKTVFVHSAVSDKIIAAIPADATQYLFTSLYEVDEKVYVETDNNILFKIDQGKLVPSDLALPGSPALIFATTLRDSRRVLLGTTRQLFLVDPASGIRKIVLQDSAFLEKNVVVSGTWVSDKLAAIGTLRGGVLFINPQTGETQEISNFYTGLPDNEVYSLFCDQSNGVWVAHDYGFTRIAPFLPFRSYNHYPGMAGNLLCTTDYKGQLFVGTSLGMFALEREEVFGEESTLPGQLTPREELHPKSGLFSFFRRKKTSEPIAPGKKLSRNVIKSIRYVYKPVKGIEGKVTQLIQADGHLIAAGNGGVFDVSGLKATPLSHDPAHFVYLSQTLHLLLVSTFTDEVKTYVAEARGGWKETHLLDTLRQYAGYIFEDKFQNIWLCGHEGALKIETEEGAITDIATIPFPMSSIDRSIGVSYGNEVYVAASGVFSRYDLASNTFIRQDTFPGPKKYFGSAGYFWFYGKSSKEKHAQWRTVNPKMEKELKLEWLSLFQNIRFLAPAGQEDGLWVITGANELYKFSSNKMTSELGSYPLFLREVRGRQSKLPPSRSLIVSQLETTVSFDFIQPDYLGMKAIEYRYRVNGLSKGWSEWAADNNVVNFSFLPAGDYKIEIQTLDLLGRTSEPALVNLKVEPPYWKQSWFFALEFVSFSLLVFFSLKLGSAKRYRFLSQLLSMLTVIMLIQFIQTVVASQVTLKSSPVSDFFVQVFIALLVLPIEGYLRKFMLRSAERKEESQRLWDDRK